MDGAAGKAEGRAGEADWGRLPVEVLAQALSWLPPETLATRCRLVCRRWRDLLDGPAVWALQWRREPALRPALRAAARCPRPPWARLAVQRPLGRNLLRNPCGTEQFRHWRSRDGWNLEANRSPVEGAEAQTCFASTYWWCEKEQVIDLLKEGLWPDLMDTFQPDIVVSDWWGSCEDCGCVYELYVALLAANKRKVIRVFEAKPEPIPQGNDASYQKVTHTFRGYGRGVRYVRFKHRGKDTQFWAGHYGARVTNSSVVVQFPPEAAESLEPRRSPAQ
ncbi:F-box only protein 27-like [Erythrolamprus reginae]|uniref:F-box only protein 27-like n=1 Tax=Erythrolamprus reginae TaxID=121349 RepID=UPI00396C610E